MTSFQTFEQDGLAVHVLPTRKFVLTTIAIRLYVPLDRATVTGAAMLPHLLLQGSENFADSATLQKRLDLLYGASLQASVSKKGEQQVLSWSMTLPGQDQVSYAGSLLDEALAILIDVMTRPHFDAQRVEAEKRHHAKRIAAQADDKITSSLERCLAEMMADQRGGIAHLGAAEDIGRWDAQSLRELYDSLLQNGALHIYVAGNVDGDSVAHRLFQGFAGRGRTRAALTPTAPFRPERERQLQEALPISQVLMNIGWGSGGVTFASDEYPALAVFNRLFGGFPHAKLFVQLREQHRLAYYVSSSVDALQGLLYVQAGVRGDAAEQAVEIVREQLKEMREGDISEDLLNRTVKAMCNVYKTSMDSAANLIDFHQNGSVAGRIRTMEEMIERVQRVTVDEVVQAARNIEGGTVHLSGGKEAVSRG